MINLFRNFIGSGRKNQERIFVLIGRLMFPLEERLAWMRLIFSMMRVKVRMHVALDFRMKEKVLLDVLHRQF